MKHQDKTKIELHILQNFAPSNLNRDDTGSPKDCELGGVRRARISSQCYKRAIRQAFDTHRLLADDERASRTKRLIEVVAARVIGLKNVSDESARGAVTAAIEAAGLKSDGKSDQTQYLLFLPTRAINALAEVVVKHFDKLVASAAPVDEGKEKKPKAKKGKADAKESADAEVKAQVTAILADGAKTPELALFGRMIADAPSWNVEAACQVAHAISTHRVSMEFDFYTAVDDFKADDNAGSSMMGTIPFTSACFYRYLTVDAGGLCDNLGDDNAAKAQAKRTIDALVRAAVLAIPSGKQNSMAAQNLPTLVYIEVSRGGASRSLANAFVEPVHPGRAGDLVSQSVTRLGAYAAALDKVYGADKIVERSFLMVDPNEELAKGFSDKLPGIKQAASLDALAKSVSDTAFGAAS